MVTVPDPLSWRGWRKIHVTTCALHLDLPRKTRISRHSEAFGQLWNTSAHREAEEQVTPPYSARAARHALFLASLLFNCQNAMKFMGEIKKRKRKKEKIMFPPDIRLVNI
jgi:hypothetical protein